MDPCGTRDDGGGVVSADESVMDPGGTREDGGGVVSVEDTVLKDPGEYKARWNAPPMR